MQTSLFTDTTLIHLNEKETVPFRIIIISQTLNINNDLNYKLGTNKLKHFANCYS